MALASPWARGWASVCLCCSLPRLSPWSRPWSCSTLSEVEDHHSFTAAWSACVLTRSRSGRSGSVRASHWPHGCANGRVSAQPHVCQDAAGIRKLWLLQGDRHDSSHDANTEHVCSAAQPEEVSRTLFFSLMLFF